MRIEHQTERAKIDTQSVILATVSFSDSHVINSSGFKSLLENSQPKLPAGNPSPNDVAIQVHWELLDMPRHVFWWFWSPFLGRCLKFYNVPQSIHFVPWSMQSIVAASWETSWRVIARMKVKNSPGICIIFFIPLYSRSRGIESCPQIN